MASPAVHCEVAGSPGSRVTGLGELPGVPVVEHLIIENLPSCESAGSEHPIRISYNSGRTDALPIKVAIGSEELFGSATFFARE